MARSTIRRARTGARSFLTFTVLLSAACRDSSTPPPGTRIDATVAAVHWGRLATVSGLQRTADGQLVAATHRRDVLIGLDIADDGDAVLPDGTRLRAVYQFLPADPDDLQARLLIDREIGSAEFAAAFARLDATVREVTVGRFSQDPLARPFAVVPRDAALRITFDRALQIGAEFFYSTDGEGQIAGTANTTAVQLLELLADPDVERLGEEMRVLPVRIAVGERHLIVDPVLLGRESERLQTRSNPRGLPGAPNQVGANIRLALAIEGETALPSLDRRPKETQVGRNAQGERAVVFDFRAGHPDDDSPFIARGFVRDPTPPRLIGEMPFLLEAVEALDAANLLVTVFKDGIEHRIDRGDTLRIEDRDGAVLARTEVLAAASDSKRSQHTTFTVRFVAALATNDPRQVEGYPSEVRAREEFLRARGVRAVLVTEFERGDDRAEDDTPALFAQFSPGPLGGRVVTGNVVANVSPFADVILRFSKPIDLDSVKTLETAFLATRRLLQADLAEFVRANDVDPNRLGPAKFATPHLVVSELFDADGTQTTLRLHPPLGLYLDGAMRDGPANWRRYWLHVVSGRDGIRDFAGNGLDLQPGLTVRETTVAMGFELDVRLSESGTPRFPDNRVVNIARPYDNRDEDEQPSIYRTDELPRLGVTDDPRAYPLEDLFGAVVYANGQLLPRSTTRVSQIADDRNQVPAPAANSELSWCPVNQRHGPTASTRFGAPIQNPLNPYGCHLQTVWREIDLSLSRVDPNDFDLDVEAIWWSPFQERAVQFDEFDRLTISLGHSERRPEPCVGEGSLPTMIESGLVPRFRDNYAFDSEVDGRRSLDTSRNAPPHVACSEAGVLIDASLAARDPSGVNSFLPLPEFSKPYFVWRDQLKQHAGGATGMSSDTSLERVWPDYLISPFLGGQGRYATRDNQNRLRTNVGYWRNGRNRNLTTFTPDERTGGLVGSIALPLLADFEMLPDTAGLPHGAGYVASGANGWQVSLTVQSSNRPDFRVYSGGGVLGGNADRVQPGSPAWSVANGGINPLNNSRTREGDSTLYWTRIDFLKRRTVATAGFVDLLNPHRMPTDGVIDPRLGPYVAGLTPSSTLPAGITPTYAVVMVPPREAQPAGTQVDVEFRAAGIVGPDAWVGRIEGPTARWRDLGQVPPDDSNFPLDPRKAGDAHVRKFSDATVDGAAWNHWVHFYNRVVTDYVADPARLHDAEFTRTYGPRNRTFQPHEVRYVNWRMVLGNNVDTNPPVSPKLESFGLVYRL
jgi:hypothetical protein